MFSFSSFGACQGYRQAFMEANKMVIRPPPLEMFYELWRKMGRPPCAASQLGDTLPNGEIDAFHK